MNEKKIIEFLDERLNTVIKRKKLFIEEKVLFTK